ncbi:MAG: ABC transporter permease subunit [Desulfobacterales bacterium]|nr:ABC transporter permease subunit [Desulfobacterales bacterium]
MKAGGTFNNISAIAKRELSVYFGSPVAYVFIVIFLSLLGFFTFYVSGFFETGQANLRGFFQWHPWLFMLLMPAISMRLWADERRLKTIELVMTLPVTASQVILGKFLAAWLFVGIALGLTFPMVWTVLYLGSPDLGAILCGYVGSFFMAGAFLSVGIMTSSITSSQVVAFIVAAVVCLFLILAGFAPVTSMLADWAPVQLVKLVSGLSVLTHFNSMERGVIDLRDLVYFLSIICFMLFANGVVLQSRRS